MYAQEENHRTMDRRTFLKYSGILGMGFAFGGLMPVSESVAFNRKLYKVTRARLSMGTFAAITVMHPSKAEAEEVIGMAFEEMDRVARLVNRYQSASAIGMLNRDGYISDLPLEVSEVIARSLYFHKASNGAFDITVKPLVDFYKAHFATHQAPPSEAELAKVLDLVDASQIRFDGHTIRFAKDGMGVTLDGIAKGYIIDCGAKVIERHGMKHALINAGGDIRAIGGKDSRIPWKVAIQNPDKEGPYVDTITMVNGAIATSGNYEVYFDQEKLYHHIVNPETGRSPLESTSVTVLAGNTMDADALSTTGFVLGPLAGKKFIENVPGTECLILSSTGARVMSNGWPSA
ncbi:MAG: FAD:protein FMN transferase [Deltaproteobacteria bacterium]|nr:FAD:protein FMN transferase [Deltaproteobacteria bacterium]MBW2019582.1 FAD:protein FMN transferase [Deltaproteobacteria bacterium]MBW2074396.1 FAD:protein FMN transferase [Deltaproteobacteria bacterium]RLB82850.1 MAG: FAD:protein FMN transferase [Deltaproteobacteria bacterium]